MMREMEVPYVPAFNYICKHLGGNANMNEE